MILFVAKASYVNYCETITCRIFVHRLVSDNDFCHLIFNLLFCLDYRNFRRICSLFNLSVFLQLREDAAYLKARERLSSSLDPPYKHLLKDIGHLEEGVKTLVNMRKDLLVSFPLLFCLQSDRARPQGSRTSHFVGGVAESLYRWYGRTSHYIGGVAEWSRRSSHDRKIVGSKLVGTTFHKPSVNSTVHPSEVGK